MITLKKGAEVSLWYQEGNLGGWSFYSIEAIKDIEFENEEVLYRHQSKGCVYYYSMPHPKYNGKLITYINWHNT